MRNKPKIFSIFLGLLIFGGLAFFISESGYCRKSSISTHVIPSNTISLKDILIEKNIRAQDLHIEVSKKQYRLSVLFGKTIIKSYPIVLGADPINDKRMEGDGCTPEGAFRIQSKYPHSKWSKFMWLNYPTPESFQKHRLAKRKGEIPTRAKIGGEIGIHGVRTGQEFLVRNGINWTKGCISLQNDHVDELYDVIAADTEVIIYK